VATSAPSREETLAHVRIVRELGDRMPGTYLGHRDEGEPSDVVLETYADIGSRAMERVTDLACKLRDAPPHPHVVRVISADRIGTGLSVVSDFVDGVPLDDVFFGLSLGGRLRAVVDVLAALSALHAIGVVHGGVLRGSSFVETTGRSKLGFAYRQPLCIRKETHAPEALLGDEAAIGPQTDVYGAGVMLWEAVTGRVLFGNEPPERVIERQLGGHIDEALPPKSDRWARPLSSIVARALEVDPKERYASAAELAAAVRIAVRARLMMHEDVVEEIWPAETKPKHTSGVVPAAAPAVAIATPQEAREPEAPPSVEPPPSTPVALTMEREATAEGASSGIVPIQQRVEAPAPARKRRSSAVSILLVNVAVLAVVALVAVVTALTLRHARSTEPVAAHPDAVAASAPARPLAVPSAAAGETTAKPAVKTLPAPDHAAGRPQHKTAKPQPRSPRLYDPSEI
jgi:serine/threonine-protein kinase